MSVIKPQNGQRFWCIRSPDSDGNKLIVPHECSYGNEILTLPGFKHTPLIKWKQLLTLYRPNRAWFFGSRAEAVKAYQSARLQEFCDETEALRDRIRAFKDWCKGEINAT